MQTIMLVGETRVGKSRLIRALSNGEYSPRRAMAVEYWGNFINTPGEFLENRWFYSALVISSADCEVVALVQDATRSSSLFPPLFASMFSRRVVGIISKVDHKAANIARAEQFLVSAGVPEIFLTSSKTGQGLAELHAVLKKGQ